MNCTTCNCEIPDGSKFCPICGQKIAQTAAAKICSGCGLQLEPNARFCSVCGTPADASSAANGASEANAFFAAPQQADSIPQPVNSIPQPVNSIPQPVNSIPQPVYGQTSDGFDRGGYQGVNLQKPASDAVPQYDPAPQYDPMPQYNPMPADAAPDYSYTPDAAAAPAKKKGGKIAIIAAAAVAAIAAVSALVFVFNKGPVMNLFLGDAGYAAMLESKTVDGITAAVSNEAVTAGIKSATETFSSAMQTKNSANSSASASDNFLDEAASDITGSIDLPAVIYGINSFMDAVYGTGGMEVSVSPEVSLTDTTKNLILEGEDPTELNKALDIINSFSITGSLNTSRDMLGVYAGLYDGMFTADAKVLISADGKAYISFPFGSETALMAPIEGADTSSAGTENAACLEIDAKELERLANAIGDVYLEYYKNGEVTIDKDGSLSAAGATAKGKLITVKITGDKLSEMFYKIGETIANDEYFCTKIVGFANACGESYTAEEYRSDILEAFDTQADAGDALVIQTVVNKNNEVLAKSFSAINDGEDASAVSITFINGTETAAFEITDEGTTVASANITKTDEHSGTVNIKVSFDEDSSPYSIKVVYSNVDKKKFLKNDIVVGTFTFSVTPPADFTESVDSSTAEIYSALSQAELTYSCDTDGNVLTESMVLNVPQYGKAGLTCKVSASSSVQLAVPADTIDISADMDEATAERLNTMLQQIKAAADKAPDSFIAQTISKFVSEGPSAFDDIADMAGLGDMSGVIDVPDPDTPAGNDDDEAAENFINQAYERIDELSDIWMDYYEVLGGEEYDTYYALRDELYEMIYTADDGIASTELNNLYGRLYEIDFEIGVLRSKLESLAQSSVPDTYEESGYDFSDYEITPLPDYNYTTMSFDEFWDAVYDLEDHYISVLLNYMVDILDDEQLSALYDECNDAYEKLYDSCDKLSASVSEGNLDASLLREAEKSAKKLDEAVRALDAALGI